MENIFLLASKRQPRADNVAELPQGTGRGLLLDAAARPAKRMADHIEAINMKLDLLGT